MKVLLVLSKVCYTEPPSAADPQRRVKGFSDRIPYSIRNGGEGAFNCLCLDPVRNALDDALAGAF